MEYADGKVKDLQIAYIGGGSRGWAWTFMTDLAMDEELSGTIRLYDIDAEAAKHNEIIGNRLSAREDVVGKWNYTVSDSLQSALTGADFIVISILPGTFDEMAVDVHMPERLGIYQSVGDTAGPGGAMRALRTIPMYVEIAQAIRAYAPKAWVINYTNPMSLCVKTLYYVFPEIKAFGCCHEVFGTQKVLKGILEETMGLKEPEEFLKLREEMVAEYESYADDTSFPMKPQKILYDVRKFMGADDIVISDVGAHKMWIAREYNCYEPNTCIISNGFATMGIAVPGAVAAKLIYPEKKVLAISGDGGFMMNSQEYETALREGTPIVTLIFSDASYGLIKWKQMDHFGHNCFVDFQNPDFVKYAESMHAKGYRVEKAEDLLPILEDAFQQKVPCIIDCPVDYGENTKLSEYLHDKFEK